MRLVSIDTVLSEQALFTGKVRDALADLPLGTPFQVQLLFAISPSTDFQPYPLKARILPGGLFVIPGDPQRAFPEMEGGASLDLRIQVSAQGYQDAAVDITLPAAALSAAAVVIPAGDLIGQGKRLSAPLHAATVSLQPLPVALNGRVTRAVDPETGLAGASVSITSPQARGPVTSNPDGFFFLPNLPVAESVNVQIQHPDIGAAKNFPFFINHRQPINQQTFVIR
jgi:hypothetical protein